MPLLRYTLLRIALVLWIWAIFRFVFQIDGMLPWVLAFVIAFLIAFIVFPGTGNAAATQLHDITAGRRRTEAPTEDELHEDAVVGELLQNEAEAEQRREGELEEPGVPQDRDERAPGGAA
ncbi:MAG: DUF4229 domain-containing protein [bacterium]|nr:DUF4229 domain-containing protein [bacterium]